MDLRAPIYSVLVWLTATVTLLAGLPLPRCGCAVGRDARSPSVCASCQHRACCPEAPPPASTAEEDDCPACCALQRSRSSVPTPDPAELNSRPCVKVVTEQAPYTSTPERTPECSVLKDVGFTLPPVPLAPDCTASLLFSYYFGFHLLPPPTDRVIVLLRLLI